MDFAEQRQHKRTNVKNLVVAILNTDDPVTIGSITDISLGGVKFTYNQLNMDFNVNRINSIDLIAESFSLVDIPCASVWNVTVGKESFSKFVNLNQGGIQFGKLTPNQIFLLQRLITRCSSEENKGYTSNEEETYCH